MKKDFVGLLFLLISMPLMSAAAPPLNINKEVKEVERSLEENSLPSLAKVSSLASAAISALAGQPNQKQLNNAIKIVALEAELMELKGEKSPSRKNLDALNKAVSNLPSDVWEKMLRKSKAELDLYLDKRQNPKVSEIHWKTRSKILRLVKYKASRRKLMMGLIQAKIELGVLDEALAVAKEWISSPNLNPEDRAEALFQGYGRLALEMRDPELAKSTAEKAKFVNKKESPQTAVLQSSYYYLSGNFKQCESDMTSLSKVSPFPETEVSLFEVRKLLTACMIEGKKSSEATDFLESQKQTPGGFDLALTRYLLEMKYTEAFQLCKTVNIQKVDYLRLLKIYTICEALKGKEAVPSNLKNQFASSESEIRSLVGRSKWLKALFMFLDAAKEKNPNKIKVAKQEIFKVFGKTSLLARAVEPFQ